MGIWYLFSFSFGASWGLKLKISDSEFTYEKSALQLPTRLVCSRLHAHRESIRNICWRCSVSFQCYGLTYFEWKQFEIIYKHFLSVIEGGGIALININKKEHTHVHICLHNHIYTHTFLHDLYDKRRKDSEWKGFRILIVRWNPSRPFSFTWDFLLKERKQT